MQLNGEVGYQNLYKEMLERAGQQMVPGEGFNVYLLPLQMLGLRSRRRPVGYWDSPENLDEVTIRKLYPWYPCMRAACLCACSFLHMHGRASKRCWGCDP